MSPQTRPIVHKPDKTEVATYIVIALLSLPVIWFAFTKAAPTSYQAVIDLCSGKAMRSSNATELLQQAQREPLGMPCFGKAPYARALIFLASTGLMLWIYLLIGFSFCRGHYQKLENNLNAERMDYYFSLTLLIGVALILAFCVATVGYFSIGT